MPTAPSSPVESFPARLQLVALCAEWCSHCVAWRPVFEAVAGADPQGRAARWIDIEDEAELLDQAGVEVQTFPFVLVAVGGEPRFLGPVGPAAGALERLLVAAPGLPALAHPRHEALRALLPLSAAP